MKIGFSLPLGYVSGTDTQAAKPGFFQWLGESGAFLGELKQRHVQTVELQIVAAGMNDAAALAAMQRVDAAGMGFSYHGRLPKIDRKGAFPKLDTPPLPEMQAFLSARGASPIMVVHAYSAETSHEELVAATVQGLRAVIENFKRHALPVRVALEINRYHGAPSPGVTYEGLLEIGSHFTTTDLGFCWDMGHTQSSILQHRLPAAPPDDFVARVIHTHIHDLSPEGDTHWALQETSPHLDTGVSRLQANGYTGIYNLELYPNRWLPQVNVKEAALLSVERLRAIGLAASKK